MAQVMKRKKTVYIKTILYLRGFMSDCPSGELDRAKMEEMYGSFLQEGNAKYFVDQMFRVFDKDGNGSIDFKVCAAIYEK